MASERIVGIDLGTTNSLVAHMQGDTPVIIPGEDGLNLVPSVVALDQKDQIIEGVTCGLDESGFLIVREDNGKETTILAGGVRPA